MKTMLKIVFIVFLTSGTCSCGTRKVQKTETKESAKTELDLKIDENHTSEKETETEKTTEINKEVAADIKELNENLEPIDSSKPITKTESVKDGVKTTTWDNAKVINNTKTDKSKIKEISAAEEKTNEKEKASGSSYVNLKKKDEVEKSTSDKGTESDKGWGFSWWWFLLLLVPVVWWLYKSK